jgi:hypothetical protein
MKHLYPILILFLFSTSTFGQISTRGAFITEIDNPASSFTVKVETDKPVYTEGDALQAYVTSSEDGYLYLFYRDADAKVSVLFPNQYQKNNFIRRGERIAVPQRQGDTFKITIGAPFGHELLKVVVSKKSLPFIDNTMDFAKFVIAPVDNNAGNSFSSSLERESAADWAEHEINIRTVPKKPQGGSPPSPPNGTAKMHLILAADISSTDNVGNIVGTDTYNIRALIENNIASGRLNIIDIQEKMKMNGREGKLTKEDIIKEISNLNVNSDDTIFFFFSGHGAYDSVADQYFALASQEQVFRSEVLKEMKSKQVRLTILISDCCYNQYDVPAHLRPSASTARAPSGTIKGLRALFEKLFFEAEGVVDITASEKGTYGFIYPPEARVENGKNKGSIFTWNLCKQLETETHASKNWQQMFELVREETNKDFQKVFKQRIDEGGFPIQGEEGKYQKTLFPHKFR